MDNPLFLFGSMVFGDAEMRERLPEDAYTALCRTIREGRKLDGGLIDIIAGAMKNWALEKGVTHYTHWFQPLSGVTAEKHDSFIRGDRGNGTIAEFTGKDLIRGEPDASSFPSGGLRETFEARGYTAWDPTSYAFIKDGILCIPSAFYSYNGAALDKKTPLLRSMECVGRQAVRLLRIIGDSETKAVYPTLGLEQEYFLIDRECFNKRSDLVYCGRTLFGAKPPKGQELEDHYSGAIRPRVLEFMKDLNRELWKLGIPAKTEHNETAPAQHELAPIYTTANIAADHNQLTMEMMKKIAERHNLACLLHEKPFSGVNGSAKHNNWSLQTDSGVNLFDYGADPSGNKRFLLFLTAVIAAVHKYQDLLRASAANYGNDMRLGAYEAPPAILSIYLGDELSGVLDSIADNVPAKPVNETIVSNGIKTLPELARDTSDRNRTSPFAFTGDKFEFRMLGSSFTASEPNTVINTIVAEELGLFSERLENDGVSDESIYRLIRETYAKHKNAVFNGNNYAVEWHAEAKRRGLIDLSSTVDALPCYVSDKNTALFLKHNILTLEEIYSRYEILVEGYIKSIRIEALTFIKIALTQILPAISAFTAKLSDGCLKQRALGVNVECAYEIETVEKISGLSSKIHRKVLEIESAIGKGAAGTDTLSADAIAAKTEALPTGAAAVAKSDALLADAAYYKDVVLTSMNELRAYIDEVEPLIARGDWPFPDYGDLLYSV